jgi:hypothetical protein
MTKILNNTRLLSLMFLVMSFGMITSCEKDDNVNSGQVQLLSFGPTGAMHGDTLSFIGNNLNKVTDIAFTGVTVAKAAFVKQSDEVIMVVVPKEAERGYVTLKTPDGDIMSKTRLNLEVVVKVTALPAQARPGDNITITGEYLNWVTNIKFGKDKWVDSIAFVSATLNQLVVKVPQDAQSGPLVIYYGGTAKPPTEFETATSLNVTLPAITALAPNPAVREQNLTITGTNLDLVKGVLFKGKAQPDTVFVSRSATQLVIKIPKEANKGKVTLVAYSLLQVESATSLLFVGDLPDLAPLGYAFYIDNLTNGWQDWGWNRTADYVNTENVRDGAASIKMEYTGQWGGLKFANGSVSTAPYNEITFSIYGTPGTNGKKINVAPSGGSTYTLTIEEGKWVEYKLTKAQLGNPATITELMFQNQDWTGKVYIDHVGLR